MLDIELMQKGMLVLTLLLLVVAPLRPIFGVVAYLFIFYVRFAEQFPSLGDIRFEFLVGVYVGLLALMGGKWDRLMPTSHPVSKAMLIFVGTVLLSVPVAFDVEVAWDAAIDFLKTCALFVMVATLVKDEGDLKVLLWAIILLTAWLGIEPAQNYFTGNVGVYQDVLRVFGSTQYFENPNMLGNMLVQCFPLLGAIALAVRKISVRVALLAIAGFFVFTIIVTGSRGAFVGLVVAGAIFAFQNRGNRVVLALSLAGIAVVFLSLGEDYLQRHMTTLEFGASDISAESRKTGLVHGIAMMIKRPILGVGIGNYPYARKAWFDWGLWAHNHYGQLFGELGIVGTGAWFWLVFVMFRSLVESRQLLHEQQSAGGLLDRASEALIALLIVRLILGVGNHSLYLFIWYLVAGLCVVIISLAKERVPVSEARYEPRPVHKRRIFRELAKPT